MRRHWHRAGWVARELRYKAAKWRRDIYTYRPTEASRRTLGTVVRELFGGVR